MNFIELRDKHAQFIYEGFDVLYEDGNIKITFDFLLSPDIRFKPEIIFLTVFPHAKWEDRLNNLVFNLGMVELLSYWKAACPPKIIIRTGYLNDDQISFWKNFLIKGLGEFFYTNKIDFTREDLVEVVILNEVKDLPISEDSSLIARNDRKELKNRDLVLVSGGKDSVVTLDSEAKSGKEFNCLMVNPTKAATDIAKAAGCGNPIIIERSIDPHLLELNKKGYLNGHTPFSAYLAFLSTLAAVVYDFKNIVVSNEASSDEGNVKWMGQDINHQYSKTSKFEKDFRNYSKKYLSTSANYFSFLREKGELEIAEIFSKMPKYHKLFRSCNKGSKLNSWCGRCPKCLSTYLTLYPYLGQKTKQIFGKDLLEDASLIPILKRLLRENNMVKPFECVATVEEIKQTIFLGRERAKEDRQPVPKLLH